MEKLKKVAYPLPRVESKEIEIEGVRDFLLLSDN
jgi:hypothetical protein